MWLQEVGKGWWWPWYEGKVWWWWRGHWWYKYCGFATDVFDVQNNGWWRMPKTRGVMWRNYYENWKSGEGEKRAKPMYDGVERPTPPAVVQKQPMTPPEARIGVKQRAARDEHCFMMGYDAGMRHGRAIGGELIHVQMDKNEEGSGWRNGSQDQWMGE